MRGRERAPLLARVRSGGFPKSVSSHCRKGGPVSTSIRCGALLGFVVASFVACAESPATTPTSSGNAPTAPTSTPAPPTSTLVPPTPTPVPPTPTPTPPTPTPTPDAQTAIRNACAGLADNFPYDITYTSAISYSPPRETTPRTIVEVRINDLGDSHTITRQYRSDNQDNDSAFREERIVVDGSTYVRGEPAGPWFQHPLFERELDYSEGVLAERMCHASFEDVDVDVDAFIHSMFSTDLVGPGPFSVVHSYRDIGRAVLNGAEVRHIQHESRIELPSITDLILYARFDEYWLTPEGRLVQHRVVHTVANGIGESTVDVLGVVSGVGEPNIIEAPVHIIDAPLPLLPTPTP